MSDLIERFDSPTGVMDARDDGDYVEYREIERLECSLAISRKKHELAIEVNKSLQARVDELEAIEHAARRLVEDGYCNDNNTQQALEAALQEMRDEHRMEW